MKRKLPYLFIIPLLAIAACEPKNNTTVVPLPAGNFSGQFIIIHLNSKTGLRDTAIANINLSLSTATGYKVTGDTTKIQAGSYGDYAENSQYITFADKTVAATPTNNKYHLNGTYQYVYDGSNFEFALGSDTIGYTYILKTNP